VGATMTETKRQIPSKSGLLNLFRKKQRKEGRENKILPVKVIGDHVMGVTRDVSASGVYFEIDSHYRVGSSIKMMIEFGSPQGMQLECEGTIVRVEAHGSDRMGVAVRMNPLRSRLMPLESYEHPLNKRPSVGVIRCANPQSSKFGQPVGACEFRSFPGCDHAARDYDKEFGCKFALLKVPALAPPAGNA
jgi:hypothetical protein